MGVKKIIRVFYIIYTIYIILVINTTSLTWVEIFPAILLMWIIFFLFNLGFRTVKKKKIRPQSVMTNNSWLLNQRKITLIIIAGFTMLSSVLSAEFYTGQTPLSIIKSLLTDNSLYYEYQRYALEQQRGVFSINKIPFIFMMFFMKLVLFYSYVSLFIIKEKTTNFEKFYLTLITLSSVYFGIARGTNFEFFELFILIIFVILSKPKKKLRMPIKKTFIIFLLGSLMVLLFFSRISARGVTFDLYISRDVTYDSSGLLSIFSPFISFVTILLYSYFGFGFFYISKYISEIWFASLNNFIAGLLPLGYYLSSNNTIQDSMYHLVDFGAKWHPDISIIINNFGFIGLLIICFLLGSISKHISHGNNSSFIHLTNFMILLQMISLPIGNFVFTSSANTLIVFLIVVALVWKKVIKARLTL